MTAGAQGNVLEEIVVTAQKRESALQDTPIAMSAFSGDELNRAGAIDAFNLSDLIPNLHVGTEGARDAVFITIRGVSQTDRRNAADPTTAFHVDGAYVPRMSGISSYFYDVERLEVLRGPQGTLYGRNSTSGVVNVITNKPNLDNFGYNGELTVGDFGLTSLKGMINAPLSDNVGARVAWVKTDRDGYRDNGPLVTADGDDADELGIRGHLLWDISDNSSLLLSADMYRRTGVGAVGAATGCPTCNRTVGRGANGDLNTTGFRDNADDNLKIEFNHSFGDFDFAYLGSSRQHDRDYYMDSDNTAVYSSLLIEPFASESTSHELRFTSNFDGPFNFIAGGYYLDEEINSDFDVRPQHISGMVLSVRFVDIDMTIESEALFLNTTYDISDRLTLTAGVRTTDDEKDKGGVNNPANPTAGSYQLVSFVGLGPVAPIFPRAQVSNPSWSETTGKVGLDFALDADTLIYGSVGTGYKAGGFNRGSSDPLNKASSPRVNNLVVFNPETITAYEGGIKKTYRDGQARLNGSLFSYDYKDLQQGVVRSIGGILVNTTINAAQATIWGAELEGTWLFGESGSANLALGYLNTEFDEFVGLDEPLTDGADNLDVSGNELINAPDITATLVLVPKVWNLSKGTLTPRLQFHYESDSWTRPHNAPQDRRESYTKTDFSLFYESNDERWYADAWVRNIEDEDVRTYGSCGQSLQGASGTPKEIRGCASMFAAPRTFGVTAGFRF